MSFWEILGLVVSGAGTLASVLGVFFGVYARQNGRVTREFIAAQHEATQKFIAAQHEATQKLIAAQHQDMREFLAQVLERLGTHVSQEEEKTREEIRKLQRYAG